MIEKRVLGRTLAILNTLGNAMHLLKTGAGGFAGEVDAPEINGRLGS